MDDRPTFSPPSARITDLWRRQGGPLFETLLARVDRLASGLVADALSAGGLSRRRSPRSIAARLALCGYSLELEAAGGISSLRDPRGLVRAMSEQIGRTGTEPILRAWLAHGLGLSAEVRRCPPTRVEGRWRPAQLTLLLTGNAEAGRAVEDGRALALARNLIPARFDLEIQFTVMGPATATTPIGAIR